LRRAAYVRLYGAPRVYYASYDSGYITHLTHDMAAKAAAGVISRPT